MSDSKISDDLARAPYTGVWPEEVLGYLRAFHPQDADERMEILTSTISRLGRQGRDREAIKAALARGVWLWQRERLKTMSYESTAEWEKKREGARKSVAKTLESLEAWYQLEWADMPEDIPLPPEMARYLDTLRDLLAELERDPATDPDYGRYYVPATHYRREKRGRPWSYRTETEERLKQLRVPAQDRKELLHQLGFD